MHEQQLPEPMVPEDCDLADFAFMPLDVARLRDSDLAANETPEACWAAVLLWSAAWHQVPAGSMPDNDAWIAKQAGYALRGRIDPKWKRVREGAMHGWVLCSDGRYHHPVVAEKARDAWASKLMQRWRTECARIKKHNDRHGTSVGRPSYEEWISSGRPAGQPLPLPGDKGSCPEGQGGVVPGDSQPGPDGQGAHVPDETHSKRQGQGQGQGQGHPIYSVPDGTGGPAPNTPGDMTKDELWRAGKSLLAEAGMPRAQCGSFVGKLVKDYGDAVVVEAVRAAVVARPADPVAYLKATCQGATGERRQPNRQEAQEARNRSVASAWAAQGETHEAN